MFSLRHLRPLPLPLPLLTLALALLLPAAAGAQAPPRPAAVPDWLGVDEAAPTVELTLHTTRPAGSPSALINGARDGAIQIVVPVGWTVNWTWESADSTEPHSLVVMQEREKIPERGGRAALTNAMTRMVTAGLRPGQPDRTTFVADQPGWYWVLCGVPGHALAGEWIGLNVDPEARTATVNSK